MRTVCGHGITLMLSSFEGTLPVGPSIIRKKRSVSGTKTGISNATATATVMVLLVAPSLDDAAKPGVSVNHSLGLMVCQIENAFCITRAAYDLMQPML